MIHCVDRLAINDTENPFERKKKTKRRLPTPSDSDQGLE